MYYVTSGTEMTSAKIKVGESEEQAVSETTVGAYTAEKDLTLVPGKKKLCLENYFTII